MINFLNIKPLPPAPPQAQAKGVKVGLNLGGNVIIKTESLDTNSSITDTGFPYVCNSASAAAISSILNPSKMVPIASKTINGGQISSLLPNTDVALLMSTYPEASDQQQNQMTFTKVSEQQQNQVTFPKAPEKQQSQMTCNLPDRKQKQISFPKIPDKQQTQMTCPKPPVQQQNQIMFPNTPDQQQNQMAFTKDLEQQHNQIIFPNASDQQQNQIAFTEDRKQQQNQIMFSNAPDQQQNQMLSSKGLEQQQNQLLFAKVPEQQQQIQMMALYPNVPDQQQNQVNSDMLQIPEVDDAIEQIRVQQYNLINDNIDDRMKDINEFIKEELLEDTCAPTTDDLDTGQLQFEFDDLASDLEYLNNKVRLCPLQYTNQSSSMLIT